MDFFQLTTASCVGYVWHPHYVDSLALRYWDSDDSGGPDTFHYYLQDANHNVTAVTDNAGLVVERYAYSPYGEATVLDANFGLDADQVSDIENVYRYTGRERDAETGLQHSRFRFYAPHLGRFLNRDPIGYFGGANLYEYVGGMPTIFVDPWGLEGWFDPVRPPKRRGRDFMDQRSSGQDSRYSDLDQYFDNQAGRGGRLFTPTRATSDEAYGIAEGYQDLVSATPLGLPIAASELATGDKFSVPRQTTDGEQAMNCVTIGAAVAALLPWDDILKALKKADDAATHGHHPLPKFLGGDLGQTLSRLDPAVHREFHSLLGQNLKNAGIPLNVGGRGGSAADWRTFMFQNSGAQLRALDAVLDTSRSMDMKHGTNITQDVWRNIIDGNFEVRP